MSTFFFADSRVSRVGEVSSWLPSARRVGRYQSRGNPSRLERAERQQEESQEEEDEEEEFNAATGINSI